MPSNLLCNCWKVPEHSACGFTVNKNLFSIRIEKALIFIWTTNSSSVDQEGNYYVLLLFTIEYAKIELEITVIVSI